MSTTSTANTIAGIPTYDPLAQGSPYATTEENTVDQDTFLTLLTTQLQHQDPLDPMDNDQFIAQLTSFSSLEQLTNANTNLENLMVGTSAVSNATMVSMIGKEARAMGNGFAYTGELKTLHYNLASDSDQLTVSIYDSEGELVKQETLEHVSGGEHEFLWNGFTKDGEKAPEGNYTFVVAASYEGASVSATTYTQGLVDQIDFSSGVAAPRIDGQNITVDQIIQIYEPGDVSDTDAE